MESCTEMQRTFQTLGCFFFSPPHRVKQLFEDRKHKCLSYARGRERSHNSPLGGWTFTLYRITVKQERKMSSLF